MSESVFGETYAAFLALHNSGDIPMRMEIQGIGLDPSWHVLEVGCGYGRCVEGLRARGLDAIGVDVNRWLIHSLARPYLRWGEIRHLDFLANSFELVVCTDVLEHVAEYDQAITELVRVSRNLIYVEVTTSENSNYALDATHCTALSSDGWRDALAAHADIIGSWGGWRFLLRKRGTAWH